MSEADANRIYAAINKHATMSDGIFGRKLHRLNLDDWTDVEAASKLAFAIDKWSRRVIQQNDLGQLSAWMTKGWARTMLQFRMFATVAFENHFLFSLRMMDRQAGMAWLNSMFMGTLAYVGLTYSRSIGRDDRKDYLAKMLTPEKIALAGFQRGAHSALLPPIIDTGLRLVGGRDAQVFSNARTSGLQGNLWMGNPTVDWINGLFEASPRVLDGELTDADARAIFKLLPLSNLHGIQQMLNAAADSLPEEDR